MRSVCYTLQKTIKKGTTTKDLLVYCAAGLPSYRLKIPWRIYWVYKGYRTIDLESDPYLCFLGSLATIWLYWLISYNPHVFRNIGPVVSWVLRQNCSFDEGSDAFLMASIFRSTLPLRSRTWTLHISWSSEARKTFGMIRIDTWAIDHACLRKFKGLVLFDWLTMINLWYFWLVRATNTRF